MLTVRREAARIALLVLVPVRTPRAARERAARKVDAVVDAVPAEAGVGRGAQSISSSSPGAMSLPASKYTKQPVSLMHASTLARRTLWFMKRHQFDRVGSCASSMNGTFSPRSKT